MTNVDIVAQYDITDNCGIWGDEHLSHQIWREFVEIHDWSGLADGLWELFWRLDHLLGAEFWPLKQLPAQHTYHDRYIFDIYYGLFYYIIIMNN